MVIGEQGDFMRDTGGNRQDWRASKPHGFAMGFSDSNSAPNNSSVGDGRAFNVSTIRYMVNDKKNATGSGSTANGGWNGDCGGTGVCGNSG